MEAIKPGSTLNQWVHSNIANPKIPTVVQTPPLLISTPETTPTKSPPLIPPRSRPAKHPSPPEGTQNPHTTTDSADPSAPEVPPRPDFLSSLSGTYISAHLLNTTIPRKVGATRGKEDITTKPKKKENYYFPVLPQSVLEDDLVTELGKQFNPTQVDLLVQIFKTWLDPQQQQQQQQLLMKPRSKKISLPEKSTQPTYLSVDSIPSASTSPDPLSQRHLGYANEGRTSPYHCLAGIARDLESADWMEGKRKAENRRHGIYFALTDVFEQEPVHDKYPTLDDCPEELSVEEAYERATCSLGQLQCTNVMRSSVGNHPRSASEGQESLPQQIGMAAQQKGRAEQSELEIPVNALSKSRTGLP